jgi:hypothetical protein
MEGRLAAPQSPRTMALGCLRLESAMRAQCEITWVKKVFEHKRHGNTPFTLPWGGVMTDPRIGGICAPAARLPVTLPAN